MNGCTQLVGIIGWPVSHSLSPLMHAAAFKHLNLNWSYVPLPVPPEGDHLKRAIEGLSSLSFRGANITIPHKENALAYINTVSDEARMIGAVNTLVIDDKGHIRGENTDARGFLADLHTHGIEPKEHCIQIVGAGGSARAILYAVLSASCQTIEVISRTQTRADKLLADLLPHFPNAKKLTTQKPTLVVNCTPPEVAPISGPIVYDISYNNDRAKTATFDGRGMLVQQGALSFELWTGQKAPVDVMMSALCSHV